MARTDTLTNFLTDVATAIKAKKGDESAIPAANFDTEITNLPDGSETIKGIVERKITNLTLPDDVTTIGIYAFCGCTLLALDSLPSSLTSIGHHAFDSCTSLKFTEIPSGVTTIGQYAFANAGNTTGTLTFKGTPTSIAVKAFQDSDFGELNVPWAEGEVANEPWGFVGIINHNYTKT